MPDAVHRKVALMGYPCVGKSSIVLRFVHGHFPDAYDTTIEDLHDKSMTFRGRQYNLRIVDTAGQQEYSLFPRSAMVDVHGYVLVYAINSRRSFELVQTIYDKILDNVGEVRIPLVLVGNKLDLQHTEREVTTEEGKTLAANWKAGFLETSAKENNQVEQIFQRSIYEIEVVKGNLKPENEGGKCSIS